jgi:hypothetical protein
MANKDFDNKEEIHTSRVKAGKRTYFFDVKETRNGDYFLTISELHKRVGRDGQPMTTRHKIFLYKEDFDTFAQELTNTINFIRNEKGADYGADGRVYDDEWADDGNGNRVPPRTESPSSSESDDSSHGNSDYSADIRFEDL